MWEAITAGVAGILALIGTVLKLRHDRRREAPTRAVREQTTIYDVLAELRHVTDASRVVLVKTHNGGGLPSAKNALYSSALYEVTGDEAVPVKQRWQGLPVDEPYMRSLSEVVEQGESQIDTRTLTGGTLADIYGTAAVQTAHKHYLTHDSTALYYLSLQWAQVDYRPGPNARLAVRAAIPRLKALLTQ